MRVDIETDDIEKQLSDESEVRQVASLWQISITLPKTNSSPMKMVVSNRNLLFQGSIFRGELLVSGRVLTAFLG